MATIWEFWSKGTCVNVHLARLISGVKRVDLDVHEISLARRSADVLGYELVYVQSPRLSPSVDASAAGQWISLVDTGPFWRSAIVVRSQSSTQPPKFTCSSFSVSRRLWFTLRMDQRAFGSILCLRRSNWSLRWLVVCICTDTSKNGFCVGGS